MMNTYHTILDEGNGGAVKLCQKEAGVQSHELTNRSSTYEAKFGGESAQQDKARTSLNMVNARLRSTGCASAGHAPGWRALPGRGESSRSYPGRPL